MARKKKVKPIELTMDMLLKMTPETYIETMKNQPLGFKTSLLNLLKAQYEQCNFLKENLVTVLEKDSVPEGDRKDIEKTLRDLYISMQLIEDRHNILDILIKEGTKH